ncbi:MarR family transcriptional regulator [Gordonia sp. Z-3]|jgi:DNA-binding MarR family transcriptional regulator|uniref:MarR family transcriptional regulator n=2 Tax=Gordonia TaxID=2053 RepID=A0A9X3D2S0_9ACTN|nr:MULTISPECIES: MarR family transcriptional regulator [Gordonia]MCF3938270.1 MarR family transcriptional regulator [Gordonia tangerina]MCX2963514.1 MarR family transcriptional regulator [Gordonia aquimaris]MED5803294.1 MarR family transcriptional regulator [Gordonia sp. Z-3]
MGSDPITDLEAEFADIWRRGRIQMRARARAIHPRLDPTCYPLLVLLSRHDAIRMSDLLSDLGLEKSTLTRQIDSVVRLRLVERHPDPDDARARLVALTDEGRSRLDEVATTATAVWRERLSRWNPDDVRQLADLLHRLAVDTADVSSDPEE